MEFPPRPDVPRRHKRKTPEQEIEAKRRYKARQRALTKLKLLHPKDFDALYRREMERLDDGP